MTLTSEDKEWFLTKFDAIGGRLDAQDARIETIAISTDAKIGDLAMHMNLKFAEAATQTLDLEFEDLRGKLDALRPPQSPSPPQ